VARGGDDCMARSWDGEAKGNGVARGGGGAVGTGSGRRQRWWQGERQG